MQKIHLTFCFTFLFLSQIGFAQAPVKPNSVEIFNQIKKLNFLGSVLYIAAHPDDENTRLISYLSNEIMARTGYLSLTRGDGGQNLIGTELRELLGVIRTQELLEARKVDGGEQFFSRANDFGYSKNPEETLQIWNKETVLNDVIYTIRKFQPDVIINRFDARTPGTTHGHHTSSALLSLEAFDASIDSTICKNQLLLVQPWQAKRLFFNTSWWFYGSKEKFENADKSNLTQLKTGVYYATIGKSNQEIAALSRSHHQSQGFGTTGVRGEDNEFLELLKGENCKDKSNLFEGIDTSWNRIDHGKPIGQLIESIEKNFDFKNPSASIPDLVTAYTMVFNLNENHWKPLKLEELKKCIAACAGLYLEAVSEVQESNPGNTLEIKIEAINRCSVPMQLLSYATIPESQKQDTILELKNNVSQSIKFELLVPQNTEYTQPYWLKEKGTIGMYRVDDQKNIGIPDIIRTLKVTFNVAINQITIPFERNIIYKFNDDVKGECYNPLDIVPEITTSILEKVSIFNSEKTKIVGVKVKAGKDIISGNIFLQLAENWSVSPANIPFSFAKKGEEKIVYFRVTPPKKSSKITVSCFVEVQGKRFDKEQFTINYPHISKMQVLEPSEAQFIKLDIRIGTERIAYIMGAGDTVPSSLRQMGYHVSVLKPEEITSESLKNFDVIVTGIRAYNTLPELAFKQNILFDFVANGHTMIVQYNTLEDDLLKNIAPFPITISRDRVTEENANIEFLEPNHELLNYPNTISKHDFEGWKQEQGLYYPKDWDKAFTPILSSNDKGETAKKGALLIAKYGKGNYIYTGLSFFRELPEGVSGAFRLMANMISIKNK